MKKASQNQKPGAVHSTQSNLIWPPSHDGLACRERKREQQKQKKGPVECNPPSASLLVNVREACRLMGGISPRTLRRLEQRGLIRSIPLTRHKLYRREDIERLVEEVASWPF